jgi:hypothetical protein
MENYKKSDSKEIYAESYIKFLTEVLGKISTKENASQRNELLERKQEILKKISGDVFKKMNHLCGYYVKTYWPSL